MSAIAASVIRMANQIAANLAPHGETVAIAETAEHISRYWDPRMRAALAALDPADLSPIARAALARLLDQTSSHIGNSG